MEGKTSFLDLCNTIEAISNTKKRLEIQEILKIFLAKIIVEDPISLVSTLYLLTGSIYPEYYNIELGIGESLLKKVISHSSGLKSNEINELYKKYGDLGKIAMEVRINQLFIKEEQQNIIYIYTKLRKIAQVNGKEANKIKMNIILEVISKLSGIERKYFIRLLETRLKIGLALQTVLIGFAQSLKQVVLEEISYNKEEDKKIKKNKINKLEIVEPNILKEENEKQNNLFNYFKKNKNLKENIIIKDNKEIKKEKIIEMNNKNIDNDDINYLIKPKGKFKYSNEDYKEEDEEILIKSIKECFNKQPNFSNIVKLIYEYGTKEFIDKCIIKPGIPLKPMLAQPIKNMTKIFEKIGDKKFLTEYKYDGERIQIHYENGKTWLFSRNCENIVEKYSDLRMLKINKRSFIIDGEVVAYGNEGILPFQILSGRKRKGKKAIKIEACIFIFDILYFDGKELLDYSLEERHKILLENFKEIENKFIFAKSTIESNIENIEKFFNESLLEKCEGIMVKLLNSKYKPSARTNSWIKMKKDYLDKVGDSIDLIVMGAYYGKGKRIGVYGGYLLGAYNDETDMIHACCKIGTGFSNENLENIYKKMADYIKPQINEYIYKPGVFPDVWLEPYFVWEIKAASISLSPIYSVGDIDGKGLSLRFPRFIRERKDKNFRSATTTAEILQMYKDEINTTDLKK